MYALHRVTGLGLLAYFLMHIFVTSARVLGPGAWQHAMALVSGPVFELGEYLVFVAFAFHAANGIRLVLIELGFVVGRADRARLPVRDLGRPSAAPRRGGDDHRRGGRAVGRR